MRGGVVGKMINSTLPKNRTKQNNDYDPGMHVTQNYQAFKLFEHAVSLV